ncbi:hypothetical protein RFI_33092, partial [Reticulomyxa filosa]
IFLHVDRFQKKVNVSTIQIVYILKIVQYFCNCSSNSAINAITQKQQNNEQKSGSKNKMRKYQSIFENDFFFIMVPKQTEKQYLLRQTVKISFDFLKVVPFFFVAFRCCIDNGGKQKESTGKDDSFKVFLGKQLVNNLSHEISQYVDLESNVIDDAKMSAL